MGAGTARRIFYALWSNPITHTQSNGRHLSLPACRIPHAASNKDARTHEIKPDASLNDLHLNPPKHRWTQSTFIKVRESPPAECSAPTETRPTTATSVYITLGVSTERWAEDIQRKVARLQDQAIEREHGCPAFRDWKLCRELDDTQRKALRTASTDGRWGCKNRLDMYGGPMPCDPPMLKVVKKGGMVSASVRTGLRGWSEAQQTEFTKAFEEIRGVYRVILRRMNGRYAKEQYTMYR